MYLGLLRVLGTFLYYFTIKTLAAPWCKTLLETLPNMVLENLPRPLLPITMRSY